MDINSVPQDDISTLANNKKAIYAKAEDGEIKAVASSGWEAEETATKLALENLELSAKEAYCEVKKGEKSPLYYYMFSQRMDLQILAETTGFFKWRISRDFKPEIFKKISDKRLSVYADALGKTIENLRVLEDVDYECN